MPKQRPQRHSPVARLYSSATGRGTGSLGVNLFNSCKQKIRKKVTVPCPLTVEYRHDTVNVSRDTPILVGNRRGTGNLGLFLKTSNTNIPVPCPFSCEYRHDTGTATQINLFTRTIQQCQIFAIQHQSRCG